MKQKIILIDMDGVLCQYDKLLLRLAHARLGLPLYNPEDITNFDTHEIFPKEYHEAVDALANEKGFFESLEPYPHVPEVFKEISNDPRFLVYICTKPKRYEKNPFCVAEKVIWAEHHLGKGASDKIIFARDKTLVHGDILIDDKPDVTGAKSPSWTHVYHDRPYNREMARPRITSWKDWKEILLPILYP